MMQMTLFSMQKKTVFIIILILTIFLLGSAILLTRTTRYENLVISEDKWERIIEEQTKDTSLQLKSMSLNDYPLIIDDNNHKVYYAHVETSKKDNPTVQYTGNDNRLKMFFKDSYQKENPINVIITNGEKYRIYTLYSINNPMINIHYQDISTGTTKGDITVIDNQVAATQKVIKTSASITITKENNYIISMRQKSVGRNDRENNISILGITMDHEFQLTKNATKENPTILSVFINDEYLDDYQLEYQEQKGE